MTGQDAVNSAKAFNEALELDGVIMTKLDGDARGGALLSVKHVTGVPIKFIGTGEHLDALEPFRPEGMASRILGMGDIVGLVDTVQKAVDIEKQKELEAKLAAGEFTLDDFKGQLRQVMQPGPDAEDDGPDARHGPDHRDDERRRRRRGNEADAGHHRLDDARRSAATPRSSTPAAATASPAAPACRCRRSTRCSSNST